MESSTSMEFTVEAIGPCRKRVSVKIPPERVAEEFGNSYRQWVKTVPIPGFRPGRAPRKLVEKRFGKQVAEEVKQTLVDAAYEQAVKEKELAVIASPEVSVEELTLAPDAQFAFDFTVTVKPEFELPELKQIEVAVPGADPTDEEIEAALLDLRKRKATLRPVEDEPIRDGDVVTLRMHGRIGETEVLHEDSLPYEVGSRWLSGLVAEGLDEALLEKRVGDTVEARAFAPPHAEGHPLADQEIGIEAEVLEMKRPDLPPVDDALAKGFDFDSKAELLETVRKDVRAHKERERDRLIENLALAKLIERADFELPEELIRQEAEDLARRTAYEMQMQKRPEEEIGRRVAEIRARRAEESARELKAFFLLDKIVDKERILVTETEVREAVGLIAAYNNKGPDEMYALLRDSGRLGSLRNQLREKKARARLRSKVKVVDRPAGEGDAPAESSPKPAQTKKKKKTTKKPASGKSGGTKAGN